MNIPINSQGHPNSRRRGNTEHIHQKTGILREYFRLPPTKSIFLFFKTCNFIYKFRAFLSLQSSLCLSQYGWSPYYSSCLSYKELFFIPLFVQSFFILFRMPNTTRPTCYMSSKLVQTPKNAFNLILTAALQVLFQICTFTVRFSQG